MTEFKKFLIAISHSLNNILLGYGLKREKGAFHLRIRPVENS
jgi:hypothetical protein